MEDWRIEKRLKQLTKNGVLPNENIIALFEEYENDKANNIPNEESEARTLLILGNMKLVYYVLNAKLGFKYPNESMDEFSIGKTGLIKAVDNYDITTGYKFSSYAIPVIRYEIFMHYRKINSLSNTIERNKISLEDCINEDEGKTPLTLIDMIGEEDSFIKKYADRNFIDDIIKNIDYLNDKERIAIIYTFGLFGNQPLIQEEIATLIDTSRSNVSRCTKLALRKLKVLTISEDELTREEKILRYKLLKSKSSKTSPNEEIFLAK